MLTTKSPQSTALQPKAIAQNFHTAEEPARNNALDSIRIGLRDIAFEYAISIRQLAETVVEQVLRMGIKLWRMKLDLKRKEYAAFLRLLGWSTIKARKYINLAKTFDGFEITQLTKIELTTLLSLCSKRYQEVVATLREIPEISQELVEQLMKSVRTEAPKQARISGWKQARSGGGRYYNVLLHDEQTGMLIEQQAQSEGVLPQKVIAEAMALLAQYKSSEIQPDEYVLAQEEFEQEVGLLRSLSIENQKLSIQLLEREKKEALLQQKIAELELLVQAAGASSVKPVMPLIALNSAPTALRNSEIEKRLEQEESGVPSESPESQAEILPTIQTLRNTEAQVKTINLQIQDCSSKLAKNNFDQAEWNLKDTLTNLQKLRASKISHMVTLAAANAIPVIEDELDRNGQIILKHEYAVKLLLNAKTWEQVEIIVGCDRDYLVKVATAWTIEERQLLVRLLSDYLRREPQDLNRVSWVSNNLLEKALSKLSFTLQKIGGPDNLVDEPTLEYVHGCCFVSLQKFGTKYEQWLFQKDEKLFPIFGRDEFTIEKS